MTTRIFPACLFVAGLAVVCAPSVQAGLIQGPTLISASTSITAGGYGAVAELVDGIGLNTDVLNGYGPDVTSGLITLTLDQPYDLTNFLLANDINIVAEGVKDFTLTFYDPVGNFIASSGTLTAAVGLVSAQDFSFSTVSNVQSVGFNVVDVYSSSPTRIEMREVAFMGTPVVVPEPSSLVLAAGGAGVFLGMRRRSLMRR